MNNKIILYLFLLLPLHVFSQGEFNHWCFGSRRHISFNSGAPVNLPNTNLYTNGGTINVSDSAGTLLFYSEGQRVFNRNNELMPNGSGLGGSTVALSSSTTVVKDLNNDSLYYILTAGYYIQNPNYLTHAEYSVLDMRLNGSLGDIVAGQKKIPLQGGYTGYGPIVGARHPNNKDVWILIRLINPDSNYFAAYAITNAGVNTVPVLSSSIVHIPGTTPRAQQIKISPDAQTLVCLYNVGMNHDSLEICHFNPITGQVLPRFAFQPRYTGVHLECSGVEFSADSKLLYLHGSTDSYYSYIFQFDNTATDSTQFIQGMMNVGTSAPHHAIPQMAPDGKIYFSPDTFDTLMVINNPSVRGNGCDFLRAGFPVVPGNHSDGMPQFVQRYKAYIHDSGNCQNLGVQFSGDIWPPADSIHWDFGDPITGLSNVSLLSAPQHTFSDTGIYTITLFVRHNDLRTDTSWKTIHIQLSPAVDLGPDKTACNGDTATFNASPCNGCTLIWKDVVADTVVSTSPVFQTTHAGTYSIREIRSNGCEGRDTVQFIITPVPIITTSLLYDTICSGDSTNIQLFSSVPGTTFYWDPVLTAGNVSGFSPDSGPVISQVLVNLTGMPGIVTYAITPSIGSCMGLPVNIPVTVFPKANVGVVISASGNDVCNGTPVTFTATPTNPGNIPVYQWMVNGAPAGTNSPVYTYTPANGDQVSCVLTSSITECILNNPATSGVVEMIIHPVLPAGISIMPSANPVCSGTPVTFTATPVNGGTTPAYAWEINGTPAGINSSTFSHIPLDGDVITCTLTSSDPCVSGNPATSTPYVMTVNQNLTAGVTVTANPAHFCPGTPVTFTAAPTNGGGSPSYQWMVNNVLEGSGSPVFVYNTAANDSVWCIMTSEYPCISGNPAVSNILVMDNTISPVVTFTRCFDTITTLDAKPFKLKGGLPLGGTYSGPGVNSVTGVFTPSVAGTGNQTITYTYTNVLLCSASKTKTITVLANPGFTCGNNLTDIRDNKVYPTVQIGARCWMKTNLDFGSTINDFIPQTDNCIAEKYHQNSVFLNQNPIFYQWDEAMQYNSTPTSQGLCPPGWHIPSSTEWDELISEYYGPGSAGGFLLDKLLVNGFQSYQMGLYYLNNLWSFSTGSTAGSMYWTSTVAGPERAVARGLNDFNLSVSLYPASRVNAFSIRCLKDQIQ